MVDDGLVHEFSQIGMIGSKFFILTVATVMGKTIN